MKEERDSNKKSEYEEEKSLKDCKSKLEIP